MRRTMPLVRLVFFAFVVAASVSALSAARAFARPWLGVYTQEVTGDLRDGLDLRDNGGVIVNRVVNDSPADRAGIRQGDVLVRFNSHGIDSPEDLAGMVRDAREGQVVSVEISRHGDRRTLQVTLAERPDRDDDSPSWTPAPRAHGGDDDEDDDGDHDEDRGEKPRKDIRVHVDAPDAPEAPTPPKAPKVYSYHFDGDQDQMRRESRRMSRDMHIRGLEGMGALPRVMTMGNRVRLGVRIESLTPDMASALEVPGGDGVLVTSVMDNTPAKRAGLKGGDVIVAVDGHEVKDTDDLHRELQRAEGRTSLSVVRRGERRTVECELNARSGDDDDDDDATPTPMMRMHGHEGSSNDAELRQQIEELRSQVRELRRQLQEERDHR